MKFHIHEIIGRLVFFQTTSEFFTKISARKAHLLRESAEQLKARVHLNLTRDFFVRAMFKRFCFCALGAAVVVAIFQSSLGSEETLAERVQRKYEKAMALEKQAQELEANYLEQQK